MPETIFLRLLETEDKAAGLLELARQADSRAYEVDTATFVRVPGSPFAYWMPSIFKVFDEHEPLENPSMERLARRGVGTNNDFRYPRLWMEVGPQPG